MSVTRRYTIADLERMTPREGERLELIDGELYVSHAPAWEHQHAASKLNLALGNWSDATGLGTTLQAPGLVFSESAGVIPDVVWISWERLRATRDSAGPLTKGPELVVEVLSPGADNIRRDREIKLPVYDREGVFEYWIVDLTAQAVDVYRRNDDRLALVGTLTGDAGLESPSVLPGFQLPISRIWPPVL